MRVVCRHGHFAFYPDNAAEIGRFANYFDESLEREEDYFTFEALAGLRKYSILGQPYGLLPATTTFEGNPWDVMRENGFVYSLTLGILVPKLSIISLVDIPLVGYYSLVQGSLLQPGSRNLSGQQMLSYSGEFVDEGMSLRVTEYTYE